LIVGVGTEPLSGIDSTIVRRWPKGECAGTGGTICIFESGEAL
jgi:hypothetical protein